MDRWRTITCIECEQSFRLHPGVPYSNVCWRCRRAAAAPTVALLTEIQSMNPLEAYVRGILSEKVRMHDRDSIREIGAILDGMRALAT